jgi:large subunit ribosomal protein L22
MSDSVVAKLRYLRVSPKKVRRIARLIKGMNFAEAEAQLRFLPNKSVKPLYKLLLSAGANAENNYNLSRANLFVQKILVDPGPSLKRWRARARGVAFPIAKRTSHITLFLAPVGDQKIKARAPVFKKEKRKEAEKVKKPLARSKKAGPVSRLVRKERISKIKGLPREKVFRRKAM